MQLRISVADWCFFQKTMDPAVYYRKVKEMTVGLNRTENHGQLIEVQGLLGNGVHTRSARDRGAPGCREAL